MRTHHLSKPRQQAVEEGFQPYSQVEGDDFDAAMRLPAGRTCGACVHASLCCAMFGHTPADTSCDFYPSRFMEAATSAQAGRA